MATQPIPTYQQFSSAAVAPAFGRRLIQRGPLLTPRVRAFARKEMKQARDRQKLLVEMLPIVKRIALQIREHLPAHVELDDLIGNGVVGLVDAVAKFDASKQVKLESYARHRIRGSILDGLRGADPVSRDMRRKNKTIQKVYREMEVKLGRPVRDEEMAAAMGLTLQKWHQTLSETQSAGSDGATRTLSAGPTSKLASRPVEPGLLADESADPFELCYRREQKEILARALSHLRERDRLVINLYYEKELTMQQIADRLQVDESRISQLHSAALVRLKLGVDSLLRPPVAAGESAPLQGAEGAGRA